MNDQNTGVHERIQEVKHMIYKTQGVCSSEIEFNVVDGKLNGVTYYGGCHGNLHTYTVSEAGGMDVQEVIAKPTHIRCGYKDTSCPDQLARALKQYLANG